MYESFKNIINKKIINNIIIIIIRTIIFYFIISVLFFNILENVKFLLSFIDSQNQINRLVKFFNYCNKEPKLIKKYYKINNPKISIISPIYNRERYIIRLLKCIQYQNFKNIEIILVDDCSIDKSVKIIEENILIDKRIQLIKNIKNKGTFISRNIGVLFSKGKYLLIPDPDDIISKNIINICYKYAEKKKL